MEDNRKILALATVGSVVWWAQRVDDNVELFKWSSQQKEPSRLRFDGVGKKVESVMWLGGERILFKDKHARSAKLAVNEGGKTIISQPAHLKNIDLTDLTLYSIDGDMRPARRSEGVLQWLGDNLHSLDQIMLPRGQRLADYVALGEDHGWALQQDGKHIHHMKADETGVFRVAESIKLPGGASLVDDPILGLILVGHSRITKLSKGQPVELQLVDTIDRRTGQPGGVKDAAIHRILAADLHGDRNDELIILDDRRHHMTAMKKLDGKHMPQASWPVFDDEKYPYGDNQSSPVVREPRDIVALDLDGDKQQDLAMLCHDRLILYLAQDKP